MTQQILLGIQQVEEPEDWLNIILSLNNLKLMLPLSRVIILIKSIDNNNGSLMATFDIIAQYIEKDGKIIIEDIPNNATIDLTPEQHTRMVAEIFSYLLQPYKHNIIRRENDKRIHYSTSIDNE